MPKRIGCALFASLGLLACSSGSWTSSWNELRGDPYALDALSRQVPEGEAADDCPDVEKQTYRGKRLKVVPPARVALPFAERLAQLEAVVADVAVRMYGREPKRLVHAGTFVCRPIRGRTGRWSEHALANAIDLVGFDFGPARRAGNTAPADATDGQATGGNARPPTPPEYPVKKRFRVRVGAHWGQDDHRGEFLRRVIEGLRDADVFRSLIGPGHPRHDDHFHLDMAPWRFRRYARAGTPYPSLLGSIRYFSPVACLA